MGGARVRSCFWLMWEREKTRRRFSHDDAVGSLRIRGLFSPSYAFVIIKTMPRNATRMTMRSAAGKIDICQGCGYGTGCVLCINASAVFEYVSTFSPKNIVVF